MPARGAECKSSFLSVSALDAQDCIDTSKVALIPLKTAKIKDIKDTQLITTTPLVIKAEAVRGESPAAPKMSIVIEPE